MRYYCPHCKKVVWRDSTKRWIKSWCEKMGRYTRLQPVPEGGHGEEEEQL